ncbi:MFS transporter [Leifsonia sp. NCR5]|uniref:MFS transporter n=1 Tax=Leifsonia sp. NCR5 TaxID=1978342 RepID=UPI0015C46CC2|nr:MFS transporter [Leifsonia sp. NCR5]
MTEVTESAIPTRQPSRWSLAALSAGQILNWGILYYAPIVAAPAISADTGWPLTAITGVLAAGLVVSALTGLLVGRLLDAWSPRIVLTAGTIVGAIGIAAASTATSPGLFLLCWILVGAAQAAVLYQAAFAIITRRYGGHRQGALTILTLAGGLASTVFAPITAVLLGASNWRTALLLLAGLLLVIGVPLHWLSVEKRWAPQAPPSGEHRVATVIRTRRFWVLVGTMSLITASLYAVTLAIIPLFTEKGVSYGVAALALGFVGAGQVVGRLLFYITPRRSKPWLPIAIIALGSTVGLLALALIPGPVWLLILVAILVGAIRGAHTLVQASAAADRWGVRNYGSINGAFAAPITVLTALAPALGPLIANSVGSYAGMATLMAGVALAALALARAT